MKLFKMKWELEDKGKQNKGVSSLGYYILHAPAH